MKIEAGEYLRAFFRKALSAADPYQAVERSFRVNRDRLTVVGENIDLKDFRRILVIGAGKGTAPMARAVEEALGDRIDDGLIVVKYGHGGALSRIRQAEAGHPIPDEAGARGTAEIVRILETADERTIVITLLSGGGSALLVSPAPGITLAEKREVTDLLMKAGAPIGELNTVRKHLSRVKGGRLAAIASPATLVTLVLSDVIGDRLDWIASGPTVPDPTTFRDAVEVLKSRDVASQTPAGVLDLLREAGAGRTPETPKSGDPCFRRGRTRVIGSLRMALEAVIAGISAAGYDPELLTAELQGEAREGARFLAARAMERRRSLRAGGRPVCLVSGGETTVTVRGNGLGGRNQELALAFALEIEGVPGITILSGATDGTDGPTDASGAVVDGETLPRARCLGLRPEAYLEKNDSYHFFRKLDDLSGTRTHLVTGPTGTNVMDIQLVLIGTL